MTRRILVTSALPYANGSIHLGHLVEYIQTDIWVSAQKMFGHEVHYVCADDTHGTPVMLRAEQENISPEQLIERVHQEHSLDFNDFGIRFDNYYTTNSPENQELCEKIFNSLTEAGLLPKKRSNNSMTRSKKCFSLTVMSKEPAQNVAHQINMETLVRYAVRHILLQN